MSSASLSALEKMLAPVSQKSPCGEDIRHGDAYDEIQEARREDDPNLPQGVWKTDIKRADWSKIISLCEKTLARTSKDLQIVGWYIEAKFKAEGFVGFIHGVHLCEQLVETYWEGLFPQLGSEESDERLRVLDWLNERIPERIYELQVAEKIEESDNFVFGEWALVSKNQKVEANKKRLAYLHEGIKRTGYVFYQDMKKHTRAAKVIIASLNKCLKARDTRADGALYKITRVLEELEGFTDDVLRDICPVPTKKPLVKSGNDAVTKPRADHEEVKAALKVSQVPANEISSAGRSTPLKERADAYAQLKQVLTYLAANEPHNPVHFLLRKALSWTNLELGQIMKDIMQHPQFYQGLFDQFGGDSVLSPPQTGRGDNAMPVAQKSDTASSEGASFEEKSPTNESGGFYPIQSPQASSQFKKPPSFRESR